MAGFDDDVAIGQALLEYRRLQRMKREIERDVQVWFNRGTALGQQVDATHRQQLFALRDDLVANLRTILGV